MGRALEYNDSKDSKPKSEVKLMELSQFFHGPNAGYLLELYEKYQQDPTQFDAETQQAFQQLGPFLLDDNGYANGSQSVATLDLPAEDVQQVVLAGVSNVMGAVNYAQAIREYGHLIADIDPLGRPRPGDPELQPEAHGITEDILKQLPGSLIGGPLSDQYKTAYEATKALKQIYTNYLGYDYDHIRIPEERNFLKEAAESRMFSIDVEPVDEVQILERLTEIEAFEDFLQTTFPTKYRFSIEGLDTMVLLLDKVIKGSHFDEFHNVLIGVAHRGRLNVMTHVLERPVDQILAEFVDDVRPSEMEIKVGWTGDVKYHRGEYRRIEQGGHSLEIAIPPNPSHLEAVNPVAMGMARAAGTKADQPGEPVFDGTSSLTILIHGDAAFPGQGIVAETFNLSQLPGYWTGGTIHIIANNQLGFTTRPMQGRSTLYASDLAKGFKVPVVHVNADHPEACIEAARLAHEYVSRFGKDFVIDLIGYRRYGHNELDEPRFTQPLMYDGMRKRIRVRQHWAEELAERGVISMEQAQEMLTRKLADLRESYNSLSKEDKEFIDDSMPTELPPEHLAAQTHTHLDPEVILEISEALGDLTADLKLLKKQRNYLSDRRTSLASGEKEIIWATAEEMAMATILAEGTPIRFTGQDVERGTFSHRHAVLRDLDTGRVVVPLQSFPQASASFEMHNSPLSEASTLGFEFGYNVQEPSRLVIWEAQYGDFINNAQVVVDEFITSTRAKWGQTPSLVMLLPHGYEGAGPDHSSGRLERFLQLAAKTNIRIANPTQPAQYYHLLRRQAALLKSDPLPLIIMTPKSLLRHPNVKSSLNDLALGAWQPVIDDDQVDANGREGVTRLVLCSGKFYYDLILDAQRAERTDVAIVRVEQLYPFPVDDLLKVLKRYPNLTELVWAQEEPKNMGAWDALNWRIERLVQQRLPLYYVGRRRTSSPAEGSPTLHRTNQKTIIDFAYSWQPGMQA